MRAALFSIALAACSSTPTRVSTCDGGCFNQETPRFQACVASFTGGFTGSWDECQMTVTYAEGTNSFTLSTNGDLVPTTLYTWTGVRITQSGEPGIGAVTMPLGSAMSLFSSNTSAPLWSESSTQAIGMIAAQLDDLGPFTDIGGSRLYSTPHGSVDATIVDTTHNAAPDVAVTVTF